MLRTWDRGVLAGIALLTALLVINATLTYRSIRQLNEDAAWVIHAHEVLDLTDGVMLALVDAETGERGFLLTARDEYLQPYQMALPLIQERMARLERETRDNPRQQDQVGRLAQIIDTRLALLAERIEFRHRRARDANALAAAEKGKAQMEEIRSLIAEMKHDEESLLKEGVRRSEQAYHAAVTTSLLTAGAGLAAVGAFVWFVNGSLHARQRAAAAIREQREWLRVTLSSIGDGVIVTDTDGKVVLMNQVARKLTGWTQEEAVNQPLEKVFSIVNEFTRATVENPVARVLREGTIIGLANHTVLVAKDASERPIDDSAAPIRDEVGNSLGVVLTFRDVTERHRADEARRRLAAIVESSEDAIVGKTLEGKITSWNRGAERLYGYTAEEVVGRPFSVLVPPDRSAELEAIISRLRHGETMSHFETVRRRKDGRLVEVSLSYSPIRDGDGRLVGTSVIARDITERKRSEAALREADRRKDEFLAMLAHELRNPLAPISSSLQILKLSGANGASAERALAMMGRQVEHMVRLVDDLLDLSRIMHGKIDLRRAPIEVSAIVSRALETAQPIIDAEDHDLSVSLPTEPLWLHGDLMRLAQVLANLLNNAAKYTERGGRIAIEAERHMNEVELRVRDSGIGISPDILPSIFDLFVQAERRMRDARGGLGIGLTVVRSLVELHGGSVMARSEGPGKGCEFVVRLPLLTEADNDGPCEDPDTCSRSPERARRRVLVVDDSRDAADSLGLMLRLQGHQVMLAHDGSSAMEKAIHDPPDVALLDIGMPVMDGYQLAKHFRSNPTLKDVLLVAVTGWGQDEDRRRSRDAGFDYHLVKPVATEDLLQVLATSRRTG